MITHVVSRFKSQPGQKFDSRFLLHLCPPSHSAIMSTLTILARERTGHLPSYAKAKKTKSLTVMREGL